MNEDTLTGDARDIGGKVKQAAGDVTGDRELQREGIGDQLSGGAQKALGTAKDALSGVGPLVDQARSFARAKPFATAALAGVVGIAILNTLRGRR